MSGWVLGSRESSCGWWMSLEQREEAHSRKKGPRTLKGTSGHVAGNGLQMQEQKTGPLGKSPGCHWRNPPQWLQCRGLAMLDEGWHVGQAERGKRRMAEECGGPQSDLRRQRMLGDKLSLGRLRNFASANTHLEICLRHDACLVCLESLCPGDAFQQKCSGKYCAVYKSYAFSISLRPLCFGWAKPFHEHIMEKSGNPFCGLFYVKYEEKSLEYLF